MRAVLLVAALAVSLCLGDQTEFYRGYKVLSAQPQDDAQVRMLNSMDGVQGVDKLTHHVAVDREALILVPPKRVAGVQRTLTDNGIPFTVKDHDFQETVNREAQEQHEARAQEHLRGRSKAVTFLRYMRYAEIEAYLKSLAKAYPNLATLESAGKSFEGRDMWVLRISKSGNKASRAVYVDAGIHAREWIAPPVALYLIQQLLEEQVANADMLDGLDWYIMPLVNPDGYEYTHTRERMWRKNRSTKSSRWCKGADVNRNFGFHWAQAGVSHDPCSLTYAGPRAFSEPESQNMRDYMMRQNRDKHIKMYLTLHSYGPLILYPWGYDYDLAPADDEMELKSIGDEANAAMIKAGSVEFTVENSAELYPAAGASDDWSKGVVGIPKAYTIELPPGGSQGFNMPASQILHVVRTVFPGLKVFAQRAKKL